MKFAIIPPKANVELSMAGDILFCLGQQYVRNSRYRDFFIQASRTTDAHIILDNGVGDHGDTIDQDVLIDIAIELRPTEVIALDVLFDSQKTIENFEEFSEKYIAAGLNRKGVSLFFCPQGDTLYDWLDCYSYGLRNPLVSTIGFSKLAIPHVINGRIDRDQGIMEARHAMFNLLSRLDAIQKPIHCLGAGDFREFYHYRHNPLMRSSDSCFTVWSAINNQDWSDLSDPSNFERIPTPKDYFDLLPMKKEQIQLAKSNLDTLKTWTTLGRL